MKSSSISLSKFVNLSQLRHGTSPPKRNPGFAPVPDSDEMNTVFFTWLHQAHLWEVLWVACVSDEEQSDPAWRRLVKRCQESASPLYWALPATPRTLALQRWPARRLGCCVEFSQPLQKTGMSFERGNLLFDHGGYFAITLKPSSCMIERINIRGYPQEYSWKRLMVWKLWIVFTPATFANWITICLTALLGW